MSKEGLGEDVVEEIVIGEGEQSASGNVFWLQCEWFEG